MHNIIIFLEASLFIYSSFLIGAYAIRLLRAVFSGSQYFALSILLGYGFWGLIGFISGLLGFFEAITFRVIFALVFIASFRTVRAHGAFLTGALPLRALKAFFKENAVFKGLVIVWIFLTLLIAFVPITGFDALKYHLPIIQDLIAVGTLTFSPEIYNYAYLPVLAEIIYAVPLVIFNNTTDPYIFQLVQYSGAVLFLLLIYGFVKNITKHAFLPIIAVLAILSMMDFQREILHGGYIDVLMFTTALASMLILLQDIGRGKLEKGNIVISALLLGFAISMKYFALFFVGFNGLLLLYHYFCTKTDFRVTFAGFLKYFSIPVLIAGFWYVRNLIVFGDPLYPIFKSTEFAQDIWWIAERTISNMFLFPFLKWGEWFTDRAGESSSMLVIFAYFAALYALIAFFIIVRRRFTFFEIGLFASVHLFMWFMFFNSHYEGYLLGSTMLLPVLLILLADNFFIYIKERHAEMFYRAMLKIVMVAAIAAPLFNVHGINAVIPIFGKHQ